MTAAQLTSHAYAEQFIAEEQSVDAARRTGAELGATPIGTGGGAALRLLAAAVGPRHAIESGTGAGTSGLWLLGGMPADTAPANQGGLAVVDHVGAVPER